MVVIMAAATVLSIGTITLTAVNAHASGVYYNADKLVKEALDEQRLVRLQFLLL
jgi:hypothetical protein